jgi:hypothetical protein
MQQEKPSALEKEHPALGNIKILNFFVYLWVVFALLDPDPPTQINADPCGSVSPTLDPAQRFELPTANIKVATAGFNPSILQDSGI